MIVSRRKPSHERWRKWARMHRGKSSHMFIQDAKLLKLLMELKYNVPFDVYECTFGTVATDTTAVKHWHIGGQRWKNKEKEEGRNES